MVNVKLNSLSDILITDTMVIDLKAHNFKNNYEYIKWLANRLGFAKFQDYINYLAKRKGFKNASEQHRQCEINNGFKRPIDYKNYLAQQRGFKDHYDYKKQSKNKAKKETPIIISHTEEDDWMYKPILNTNTRTNYDGNEINHEWMD